jgi:myo-inositol-1-phosphate synthase
VSDNVIDMQKWKLEKKTEDSVKQYFRDSLDNEQVKKNYKLTETPTLEQRAEKINASIKRINSLITKLHETNKKDN